MATEMTAQQAQMVVLLTQHGSEAYRITLAALIAAQLGGNPVAYFEVMQAARYLLSIEQVPEVAVPPASSPAPVSVDEIGILKSALIVQTSELAALRARIDVLEKKPGRRGRTKPAVKCPMKGCTEDH